MKRILLICVCLIIPFIYGYDFSKSTMESISFTAEGDSNIIEYEIYTFSSIDEGVPLEYNNSKYYIENYSIYYSEKGHVNGDIPKLGQLIFQGSFDLSKGQSITIPISEKSLVGNDDLEFIVVDTDYLREREKLSKQGIISYLSTSSINVFYSVLNEETKEERLLEKETLSKVSVGNSASNIRSGSTQYFAYMYASITVSDEYNGNQKRQHFSSTHAKRYQNSLTNGLHYVSTTSMDSKADVIALGWSLGGTVGMYDSSIVFQGAYNLQCELCMINGTNNYASSGIINRYSTGVSMHSSLFTGNAVAFNIPDYISHLCSNNHSVGTRPAYLILNSNNGWYNKGSYNGASGVVRTEYLHSYASLNLSLDLNLSIPASISFSPNLVENSQFEKTWVYATISPN